MSGPIFTGMGPSTNLRKDINYANDKADFQKGFNEGTDIGSIGQAPCQRPEEADARYITDERTGKVYTRPGDTSIFGQIFNFGSGSSVYTMDTEVSGGEEAGEETATVDSTR